ncbi:MAG TPA: putative baseplate assembly protein [Candidatus Bathyarchaeia archaeon]|nr:putative baseplate assembly protein [Candidatus Bathyarchaeia archaeon]
MPLLLPNLDDRTWADLVAEGTSLIPVYGPQWTDQNYSDPGITLVELCAWVAEMDIYQLNQISDRERLKFLALVGLAPKPPIPAHVILGVTLAAGIAPITLPTSLEFSGIDPSGITTSYRILHASTLAQGTLAAIQLQDSAGFHDLTPVWRRQAVMNPFGTAPQPGMAVYFGLTAALPVDQPVRLFFTFADGHSGFAERKRLVRQLEEMEKLCHPDPYNPCQENPCQENGSIAPPASTQDSLDHYLKHYGVRTVWEYQANIGGQLQWIALNPANEEVLDETRAFTLDGPVTFRVPQAMAGPSVGAVAQPYYYVRCRFTAGSYDAAPLLQNVVFNGILAEQAVASATSLVIDPNATINYSAGGPPTPNTVTTLQMKLDAQNTRIVQLTFGGGTSTDPQFRILNFQVPVAAVPGALCWKAAFLGFGDGLANQQFALPNLPVKASSLQVYTSENGTWYRWELRRDFDASTRKDFHAVPNATTGAIFFGNGEKGRVPPANCEVFATNLITRAQAGNLPAGTINQLADSPHNRAILYDPTAVPDGWTKLRNELQSVTNPRAAWGGAAAETIDQTAGEADQLVGSSGRAVTLADYERLAANTPGTRIARVTAIANMHPDFPCYSAPGMITVIVLPYLPHGSPMPTPGLLAAVTAYLRPRRVIGTRVEVVGPTYLEVAVQATVQSMAGTNRANLQQAIVQALNNFLDPLIGGPEGRGWPFGRDVYRSEIMKVIDAVVGVDYITSLALLADCGQPQCGNVCLGPTWLVQAGTQQITVL